MKVVMINGSRRENGCTRAALGIIADELKANDIETSIFSIGKYAAEGNLKEIVDIVAGELEFADGFIVGSPVYYASPSGEVISFLDQLYGVAEKELRFKPAAAIASARRAGTTATLDVLNKYFAFNQMPVISSRYWNMVHGNTPEQIMQDEEGIQIMKTLADNMSWILKCIEAGKKAGVCKPEAKQKIFTNFIR